MIIIVSLYKVSRAKLAGILASLANISLSSALRKRSFFAIALLMALISCAFIDSIYYLKYCYY